MRRSVQLIIFFLGFSFFGFENCRSLPRYEAQLTASGEIGKAANGKYIVFPFEFAEGLNLKEVQENNQKIVSQRNREKAEAALFASGATVLERSKVDKLLNEITLSKTGITESDGLNIGKLLNANYAVFGRVTNYGVARRRLRQHFTAEIILKGVNIETGVIVWECILKGHSPYNNGQQTLLDTENKLYEQFTKKFKEKTASP
ncbi:curli production assembly/transport component CsgG domain protein [Leptospira langatensis]|uniref:Curli production assembly/transport component CsgG domain protein n=1 Tax=Leptospira langatensis TaxID=2484983 RepID=A0A5F1ZWZ0_9LEPT|nr:CsgG/HfaB family protein [Leptospira langatensis]TGJ98284.1 curli production assembly/transport component CsgG domain protein [Leptospira langatensis]TGL43198.1 curli production assembly/transport component CsgG domain protein [Leptospira langatensis]